MVRAKWNYTTILGLTCCLGILSAASAAASVATRTSGVEQARPETSGTLTGTALATKVDEQQAGQLQTSAAPARPQQPDSLSNPAAAPTVEHSSGSRTAMGGGVDWTEDFESYPNGNCMDGEGGWEGWVGDVGADACLQEVTWHSFDSAVDIGTNPAADLVRVFTGFDSGVWNFCTWQFIPNSFLGETFFILLNTYPNNLNWSTQISFDSATGLVESEFEGATLPMITGEWVELCVEIDLVLDSQTITYDGTVLSTKSWADGVSGGGALNIAAVDLFSNGASPVFYDDLTLIQIPDPCGDGSCDDGEDCCNCELDCGPCVCGDGTCNAPCESFDNCTADCGEAPECTVFTNQAEFEAFNLGHGKGSKGTEDFEEGNLGPNGVAGMDDPLCGGIPSAPAGTPYPNGLDQLNICLQSNLSGGNATAPNPRGLNGLAAASVGFNGAASDIVIANTFVDSLDLMFGDPVPPEQQDNHTGVGFDTLALLGGASIDIQVFDKNNALVASDTSPADPGGSNFWGIWCSSTIGRINIFDSSGGAEGGDNIQLWVDLPCEPECPEGTICLQGSCCGDGVVEGAEECDFGPTGCGDCPTDTNGDGITNATDLAQLLGNWGPLDGDELPNVVCLDSNTDGIINATDLAQLLGNWGPCPDGPGGGQCIEAECLDNCQCVGRGACCGVKGDPAACDENLTQEECEGDGGAGGNYGGDDSVCNDCPDPVCFDAEGSCFGTHPTPGCANLACCGLVCNIDPFCCEGVWDNICVGLAEDLCPPPSCGDGSCDPNEGCCGCEVDCGACVCGDGNCDAPCEEDGACPDDCAFCGDGACGPDEDNCNCPVDCEGKCDDLLACPADSLFSQQTALAGEGAEGTVGATSDQSAGAGFLVSENFSGVMSPITDLHFWGIYVDFGIPAECARDHDVDVTFYDDAAGAPGAVAAGPWTITPVKTDSGEDVATGVGPLSVFRFDIDALPEGVSLETGWVSVQAHADPADLCYWLWSTAPPGDGGADQDGGATDYDLAMCLTGD